MSAVSRNVTPASSAASITARDAASSIRPPKLLQPRPTTDTSSSDLPRRRVRITGTLVSTVREMAQGGGKKSLQDVLRSRREAPALLSPAEAAKRESARRREEVETA